MLFDTDGDTQGFICVLQADQHLISIFFRNFYREEFSLTVVAVYADRIKIIKQYQQYDGLRTVFKTTESPDGC